MGRGTYFSAEGDIRCIKMGEVERRYMKEGTEGRRQVRVHLSLVS